MANKLLLVTCLLFAIFGLSINNAAADNREGAIVLSPSIGPYLFDQDRNLKNNPLYNVGLGYDFNNNWGIEALAGTVHTTAKGSVGTQNVIANLYTLDGVYHFNLHNPFVPYLLAGAGILDINQNPNATDANTQPNFNAGAGLEYFLGKSFALRSDVRDIYTMNSGKSDVLVNFGVSVLLGGQPQAVNSSFTGNQTDQCLNTKAVVRFANRSTIIDPIYKAELEQLTACLANNPALHANLDGYSSAGSTAQSNLKISQERAEQVKNYLVTEAGIDPSRLNAQGFGEGNSLNHLNGQSDSVILSVFPGQR